jgi:hypothetical protein
MKRLLRIFELSKSEQRVMLIVIVILIAIAFVEYEHRVHHVGAPTVPEVKRSPSPIQTATEQ